MQGLRDFIIKVDYEYENKIKINDQTLILTSVFDDPFQLVKSAVIVETPVVGNRIKAKKGDYLWFSYLILKHNLDRHYNKIANEYVISEYDKTYRVPEGFIYAYTLNGEFVVPDPYLFVKPLDRGEIKRGNIILPGEKNEMPQIGTVKYSCDKKQEGKTVIFSKDSEFEIKVFGERLYRMKQDWIIANYG